MTADAESGELAFYNQVVRNDLKLSKKAEDTNVSLQVPFAITNVATGETHVLVTDSNGQASTEAGWSKHTHNTNANDHLIEAEAIASDMMDTEVFLVKLVFRLRGGDEMLDSLSGRSRHHGEVFEGTAQARGGVVRAVRA